MVAARGKAAAVPEEADPSEVAKEMAIEQEQTHISNWEFLTRPPTSEEVLHLLGTLPPVHGIRHEDYADFVQALPARKKISVPHPTNPKLKVEEYIDNWTLYMSVAGRQAMLNAAQELNNWRVEIEPEPNSPVGAPGFLSLEQRIVYREYIKIWQYAEERPGNVPERYLGSRNGQAWVPFSGGSQAAGSNPYEKVETSARGRALGAWGFGVFPGSGIASLEEMLGVEQNKRGIEQEQAQQGGGGRPENPPRRTREGALEETMTLSEEFRQLTGDPEDVHAGKIGRYVTKTLGAVAAYDGERNELHWDGLKDGQLVMMANMLRGKIAQIKGEL